MASTETDRLHGVTASLAVKAPVRAATTANITLSGEQTIDGVAVVADDRVLVKSQTDGIENGVYDAKSGAWVRALDFDGTRDVKSGTFVVVASGTAGAGTLWRITTADDITIGTTSIAFALMTVDSVTAFIATLLDDGTAAVARATLAAQEDVITTRGDIVRGDSSGDAERLAAGAADTFVGSDGTDTSFIAAATQAEQETGTATNKPVTPGRQHSHQSAAKGWCRADLTTGKTRSYNVTSVTDLATGITAVNWDTDFSDTDYCVVGSAKSDLKLFCVVESGNLSVGGVRLQVFNDAGTATDPVHFMVMAFGDQ